MKNIKNIKNTQYTRPEFDLYILWHWDGYAEEMMIKPKGESFIEHQPSAMDWRFDETKEWKDMIKYISKWYIDTKSFSSGCSTSIFIMFSEYWQRTFFESELTGKHHLDMNYLGDIICPEVFL